MIYIQKSYVNARHVQARVNSKNHIKGSFLRGELYFTNLVSHENKWANTIWIKITCYIRNNEIIRINDTVW